ncbi:MAG: sialate O-acetylesterase [Woeseiaceae bacterium]|nr:sialate O-acetylesterase [Woeseiaceae bacterium]
MRSFTGLLLIVICASTAHAADYKLYFLGGQSNMDGFGYASELPDTGDGGVAGVRIFRGNVAADDEVGGGKGLWAPLTPGFGLDFTTDGVSNSLSDRFGPELTFGTHMKVLFPDDNIAILKYSRGGTALMEGASGYGTWAPDYDGVNQYDHALNAIRIALSSTDIDGDGEYDNLQPAGIVWMQGEADAYDSEAASRNYEANLKRMMDLLRAALRTDDLPVVIGRITDSGRDEDGKVMDYSDVVQAGQEAFVDKDSCAAYDRVTDELAYPEDDDWHYTTDGYLKMGESFAETMAALETRCGR